MSSLLRELEHKGRVDPAGVDPLLHENTFPIIEGTRVTFVFRGAADEVHLRHWIYGLSTSQAFNRVAGTDLWVLHFDLPETSRMEYKLEVVNGDEHRLIQDPLNPLLANDPFGANSVVHATGYEIPEWSLPDPNARPGHVEDHRFQSDALGVRPLSIYFPARYNTGRRYPLLVVHDGQDYLRFSELETVLDNLIHRLEIPPMVVALTQSPDRLREYANDERHARFLVDELVPFLESEYPLVGTPSARGVVGASFGAIAALSTAWRNPGFFGKLLLQSGSFAFTDIGEHDAGPAFDPIVEFVNAFREDPRVPAEQLFQTCGTFEPMIYYNRSMVPLFQSTGMSVRFVESRDGHNWECWRDRLREGLSWLFPGPLWMVYE